MSFKKVKYYVIDQEMNAGCQGLPVKTHASVTVKLSKRTVADCQRCLENCIDSVDSFEVKGLLHQILPLCSLLLIDICM